MEDVGVKTNPLFRASIVNANPGDISSLSGSDDESVGAVDSQGRLLVVGDDLPCRPNGTRRGSHIVAFDDCELAFLGKTKSPRGSRFDLQQPNSRRASRFSNTCIPEDLETLPASNTVPQNFFFNKLTYQPVDNANEDFFERQETENYKGRDSITDGLDLDAFELSASRTSSSLTSSLSMRNGSRTPTHRSPTQAPFQRQVTFANEHDHEVHLVWGQIDYERANLVDTATARIMWEIEAAAEIKRMLEFRWTVLEAQLPKGEIHPERRLYLEEQDSLRKAKVARHKAEVNNTDSCDPTTTSTSDSGGSSSKSNKMKKKKRMSRVDKAAVRKQDAQREAEIMHTQVGELSQNADDIEPALAPRVYNLTNMVSEIGDKGSVGLVRHESIISASSAVSTDLLDTTTTNNYNYNYNNNNNNNNATTTTTTTNNNNNNNTTNNKSNDNNNNNTNDAPTAVCFNREESVMSICAGFDDLLVAEPAPTKKQKKQPRCSIATSKFQKQLSENDDDNNNNSDDDSEGEYDNVEPDENVRKPRVLADTFTAINNISAETSTTTTNNNNNNNNHNNTTTIGDGNNPEVEAEVEAEEEFLVLPLQTIVMTEPGCSMLKPPPLCDAESMASLPPSVWCNVHIERDAVVSANALWETATLLTTEPQQVKLAS